MPDPEDFLSQLTRNFFVLRCIDNVPHAACGLRPVRDGGPNCQLAIMEFDDQGLCFDRASMRLLEQALAALAGKNPIIVTFAHGLKHNADAADENLKHFESELAWLAGTQAGAGGRPVLGVFISWRGLSRDGNWFWMQGSFWDRQEAAQRVALGSAREVFSRLKLFRNGDNLAKTGPQATLIVIGHSFGGLITFAAVAQSLIESAVSSSSQIPSFGDLVLLVNPAFSAVSYLPIRAIVSEREFDQKQPIFVSVTAENDDATKIAFPLGNFTRLFTEAWRTSHERQALIRTMGHLSWLRTHAISKAPSPAAEPRLAALAAAAAAQPVAHRMRALAAPNQTQQFDQAIVTSAPGATQSPFWVASATPDVIDGHNGIFGDVFRGFVRALVAAQLQDPHADFKGPA
jgi:pimeloyl-ACP methyl ester carboxylesterase